MIEQDLIIYQGQTTDLNQFISGIDTEANTVTLEMGDNFNKIYYEYPIELGSVIAADADIEPGYYRYVIKVDDGLTVSIYKRGRLEVIGEPINRYWRNS